MGIHRCRAPSRRPVAVNAAAPSAPLPLLILSYEWRDERDSLPPALTRSPCSQARMPLGSRDSIAAATSPRVHHAPTGAGPGDRHCGRVRSGSCWWHQSRATNGAGPLVAAKAVFSASGRSAISDGLVLLCPFANVGLRSEIAQKTACSSQKRISST